MSVMSRILGACLFLLLVAGPSWALIAIDYDPGVRNGGFEDADTGNSGGPSGQWHENTGLNRVTDATAFGGPAAAASGEFFGVTHATINGPTVQLVNPQPLEIFNPPLLVASFDLEFDWAATGDFRPGWPLAEVRLWNSDASLQQGYIFSLTPDGTPTTWEHASFHVDGPFIADDLTAFSDIGIFRLLLGAWSPTTGSNDGFLFVDNVRLTLNELLLPEPASISVLGLALISLGTRRPQRRF
jgi:hypothetical protein